MGKTVAYLRVSTDQQDLDNQRFEITRYAEGRNFQIDDWIEVEVSSRKNLLDRRISEMVKGLKRGDRLIVSELSRLARSMRETHNIVHDLAKKKVEFHAIKQNLHTKDFKDMTTKVLINAFSLAAEIERDLISRRTKEALARLIRSVFQILFIIVVMFVLQWQLTLVALLVVPVMLFFTGEVQMVLA